MTSLTLPLAPLGLLLAWLPGLYAPAPTPDCRQQLLAAYRRLKGDGAERPGVYHVRFTSTSRYAAPGQRTPRQTQVQGELFSQGQRFSFQTPQLHLWQDGHYVAMVMHSRRTVLVTRVVPGQTAEPGRLLGLRDSLLQVGTLRLCVAEQQGKLVRQHVQLTYAGVVGTRLRLKQLDFWLGAQQTLTQLRVQYQPGNPIAETTLQFPVQEWLSTATQLPADARQQVLTPQGQLRPAFKGYQLINQVPAGR